MIMGLSGLYSWNFHPDFLIKPLTDGAINKPSIALVPKTVMPSYRD
jgi:hypothetical protein